jgi:thioredoxin reductase (NADPH)
MSADTELAFPVLTPAQIDSLRGSGHLRSVTAGEVLFQEGDRGFCFYVVIAGSVEIVETSSGEPKLVTVHRQGQFSGDVDMLSGRVALVTARVGEAGQLLEIDAASLRKAVADSPQIGEILVKAFLARRALLISGGLTGVRIIGSRFSPDAHRLRDFATRNGIPFTWIDLETDEQAETLLREFNIPPSATPVVLGKHGKFALNPSLAEFGHCAGLDIVLDPKEVHDLLVVGGGPAGLAAAVYAASEGLDVVVLEKMATGGQAGTSSRIDNYLGFPAGISGAELTRAALLQAQKFGARITVPAQVKRLRRDGGVHVADLADGSSAQARCVLVASGVKYRRLDVPRIIEFEGAGVYYAATEMEARLCRGEQVVVVGGGNSAGQAVVFLASQASRVHLVIRGDDLGRNMSRYLVDRIEGLANVTVHRDTTVTAISGDDYLASVTLRREAGSDRRPDQGRAQARDQAPEEAREQAIETRSLFLFIGADPHTDWLRGAVQLDRDGFVMTGTDASGAERDGDAWGGVGRPPFLLETSVPGVFAAGDVRSGSIKRCASAVGEGSMAVSFVHAHIGALARA